MKNLVNFYQKTGVTFQETVFFKILRIYLLKMCVASSAVHLHTVVHGLFYDAVSGSECTAPNGSMSDEE
jgi:hypothetical protein